MNQTDAALPLLVTALRNAKEEEDAAKKRRLEIEEQIVALFPQDKGFEGTVSDGGVSISWKVTRTVDTAALQAAWEDLSANAQKAFRWKADLDLKSYRAIHDFDPAAARALSLFVTTKDAKPSITIKE